FEPKKRPIWGVQSVTAKTPPEPLPCRLDVGHPAGNQDGVARPLPDDGGSNRWACRKPRPAKGALPYAFGTGSADGGTHLLPEQHSNRKRVIPVGDFRHNAF